MVGLKKIVLIISGLIIGYFGGRAIIKNFISKDEYPVKVGQVWKRTQTVIPYYLNRPSDEIDIIRKYRVTEVDEENDIIYFTCNSDKFELSLQGFLHESTLEDGNNLHK